MNIEEIVVTDEQGRRQITLPYDADIELICMAFGYADIVHFVGPPGDHTRAMIPPLWTDADEQRHLEDCPNVIDITEFGSSEPRHVCGRGEASRHTPPWRG